MNHHQGRPDGGGGIRKPAAMFPSHNRPPQPPPPAPLGLVRYGSAPGSFLSGIADSVIAGGAAAGLEGRLFLGESPSLASESSCKSAASTAAAASPSSGSQHRPYSVGEATVARLAPGDSKDGGIPLLRQSSSPAGFFSHLLLDSVFSVPRDFGSCSRPGIEGVNEVASGRLKSQLSFSGGGIPVMGYSIGRSNNSDIASGSMSQSYISSNFSVGSWDDDTNSIIFSAPPSKRAKHHNDGDIVTMSNIESQFRLPNTTLEMATMDKYLQLQHDQVPFKVRAKRGCATHPRSIAERERRTRISDKLKRLQELVPNMDKQTNTADMLDLAIKHIKGLQSQIKVLKQEQENCKCKQA